MVPEVVGGKVLLRRSGDEVVVVLSETVLNATGTVIFPRLEFGFRPVYRLRTTWHLGASSDQAGQVNITTGGYWNLYGVPAGDEFVTTRIAFETSEPWPVTYPGVPQ